MDLKPDLRRSTMDDVTRELMIALGRLAGVRGDVSEGAQAKIDVALLAIEDVVSARLRYADV